MTSGLFPLSSVLLNATWVWLASNPQIDAVAGLTNMHPVELADVPTGKGLIVMSEIADPRKGKYLTNSFFQPRIQFACYAPTEAQSRLVQETLMQVILNRKGSDLDNAMSGQIITSGTLEKEIPTYFNENLALFCSVSVYMFSLTRS